jgi:inhibitor of cysteine peptidase
MRNINKIFAMLLILFAVNSVVAGTKSSATEQAANVYTENKAAVIVLSDHPEFTIKLQSNPSTGYTWFLRSYDANLLQPTKHVYEASANKKLMGAPGYEIWTFHVKQAGFTVPMQTFIRFVYARPWESDQQAKQIVFSVTTHNKH